MTHAIKGALLSGLVYPGAGQLSLKHYRRAAAFIVAASTGVAVIVLQAVQRAMQIVAQFDPANAVPDVNQILLLIHRAGTPGQALIYHLALVLLAGSWGLSVLDAYLGGRRLDRGGRG